MIRTVIAAGFLGLPLITAAPALADAGDISCAPCVITDDNGLPLWDETLENFRQAPGWIINNWSNMPNRAAESWGSMPGQTIQNWSNMPKRTVDSWSNMPQRTVDNWSKMPQRAVDNWSGNSGGDE